MSIIRPFQGIRPAEELASQIAALPYDVYNSSEARKIVNENPLSFLAIDRAETMLSEQTDPYDPLVYKTAKNLLDQRIADGLFIQDEEACFYVYSLTMNGRTQTGLVACASIDDYMDHVILKHENTLAAKEEDRIRHVDACSAQTGPIFLTYRPHEELRSIIQEVQNKEPVYDFVSEDQIGHRVWVIDDTQLCKNISQIFCEIPKLYIADGHHRAASAVKVGLKRRKENPKHTGMEEYNYFLSVLFPSDELEIFDYNRVITAKNSYTFEGFLDKIKGGFDVTLVGKEANPPRKKGEIGLYMNGQWYLLEVKPKLYTKDPVKDLDVSILQDHILEPVFGIRDPKTDSRIRFIGGIRGLEALKDAADNTNGVAFAMYPTSMHELLQVADEGRLMPPKSTWFEPKLRSGLFIHRF